MLHQSGEDYLETILILKNQNGTVRSIEIAEKLGYSKPSVSRAMANLKKLELIEMDSKGLITFTEKGLETATKIYERHQTIMNFLITVLDVSEEIAEDDGCKIEHILHESTIEKMKSFTENYKK